MIGSDKYQMLRVKCSCTFYIFIFTIQYINLSIVLQMWRGWSEYRQDGPQREGNAEPPQDGILPTTKQAPLWEWWAWSTVSAIHIQVAAFVCGVCRCSVRIAHRCSSQPRLRLRPGTHCPQSLPSRSLSALCSPSGVS